MVQSKIDRKSLGQLFLVGFRGQGSNPEKWILRTLAKYDLGGVLLFDRNIDGSIQNFSSPESLMYLVRKLNEHTEKKIFIAVDQEGGSVSRLKVKDGFPSACSAFEMSQGGEKKTREQAGLTAQMLAAYGINLNFAPVVDLNINEDNPIIGKYRRSFGKIPEEVALYADSFINEHAKMKIGCCIKHFPGHGSSAGDSHKGFVDITESWQQEELEPYRILIDAGYEDGIMTGHLVNRKIDPSGHPATLSTKIIHGILRRQYNFSGVVFSDDLQMSAITNGWEYRKAVQLAIMSGVDVLVSGNNLSYDDRVVDDGVEAVEELLDQGLVQPEHIQQSIDRIIKFKERIR